MSTTESSDAIPATRDHATTNAEVKTRPAASRVEAPDASDSHISAPPQARQNASASPSDVSDAPDPAASPDAGGDRGDGGAADDVAASARSDLADPDRTGLVPDEPRIAELDLRDGVSPTTGRIEAITGFDDLASAMPIDTNAVAADANAVAIEVDRQTDRKDVDLEFQEPVGFALDDLLGGGSADSDVDDAAPVRLEDDVIDIELDVIDEPETNPYAIVPAPRATKRDGGASDRAADLGVSPGVDSDLLGRGASHALDDRSDGQDESVDSTDDRVQVRSEAVESEPNEDEFVENEAVESEADAGEPEQDEVVESAAAAAVAPLAVGLADADEDLEVDLASIDDDVEGTGDAEAKPDGSVQVEAQPPELEREVVVPATEPRHQREHRDGIEVAEEAPRSAKWLVAAQLLCLLAIPALVWVGYQNLLEDNEGTEVVVSIGPGDPGYVAAAPVTPVMYVVQVNQRQQFVGAAILSQPDAEHGLVTVLPPTMVIPDLEGRLRPLEEIYAEARREVNNTSTAALVSSVATASFLDVGFIDGMEILNPNAWERVLEPLGPLEVERLVALDDGLGNVFPAGSSSLDAASASRYVSLIDPEETAVEALQRQQEFWLAWLGQLQDGGLEAVAGETNSGFGGFLAHFAQHEVRVEVLPGEFDELEEAVAIDDGADGEAEAGDDTDTETDSDAESDGGEDVDGDSEAGEGGDGPAERVARAPYLPASDLPAWLAAAAPFPQSENRVPLRLLNGTTDQRRHIALIPQLVAAGSQIDLLGNAVDQNVARTRIEHYSEETAAQAMSLANVLGVGEVEMVELEGEPVEITVLVGDDAPDPSG